MPNIPINSIAIPDRFVTLCINWHGDAGCMLYAVASTGGLTTGTRLPYGCDSDEQWYVSIWRDLAADVGVMVRMGAYADDAAGLVEFEAWVDNVIEQLERAYALGDWERA